MSAKTIILQDDEVVLKASELDALSDELELLRAKEIDTEKDTATLKNIVYGVLNLLGLVNPNTGKVYEDIAAGKRNIITPLLKGLAKTSLLVAEAKLMGHKKEGLEKMDKNLGFVKEVLPMLAKMEAKQLEKEAAAKQLQIAK